MPKWTPERKQEAAHLYRSGKTIAQISMLLHTTYRHVRKVLADFGIPIRSHKDYRNSYVEAFRHRKKPVRTVWTPERDREVLRLYATGMFQSEIAKIFGTSQGKVYDSLRRSGVRGNRRGRRNASWTGGRLIDKSGYVLIFSPANQMSNKHGYVREHRLIMSEHLGRPLSDNEVVHHRNGNRADNRLENLCLYETNADHLSEDLKGRRPKWTEDGKTRLRQSAKRLRPPGSKKFQTKTDDLE